MMIIRAILSAGFVAYGLRGVLDETGLPNGAVMSGATVVAITLAAIVTIEFFGKKFGGSK
jgi:hypothetical protein